MFVKFLVQLFVQIFKGSVALDSKLNLLLFKEDTDSNVVNIFAGSLVQNMFLLVFDEMSVQTLRVSDVVVWKSADVICRIRFFHSLM